MKEISTPQHQKGLRLIWLHVPKNKEKCQPIEKSVIQQMSREEEDPEEDPLEDPEESPEEAHRCTGGVANSVLPYYDDGGGGEANPL